MFFLISKIFGFVSSPVTYIVLLVIAGIWLRKKKWKQLTFGLAIFLLLLFSNRWVYYESVKAFSGKYVTEIPSAKRYNYGIVLGGFSEYDARLNRINFNKVADRLTEAVNLYHKGIIRKLIITGDGSILDIPEVKTDPEVMLSILQNWGVSRSDVILERKALNTRENAVYTLQLLGDSLKSSPSLLITSATHMKRSLQCFNVVGVYPDFYGTDVVLDPQYRIIDFFPDFYYLSMWQELIHEWIGMLVYHITG
jgi:uncharacterized SAM-binding protein YcdF (DUF218 family)